NRSNKVTEGMGVGVGEGVVVGLGVGVASTATPAVLLVSTVSNWSVWVIVAVFVYEPGLMTRVMITSVSGEPGLTAPTLHRPVLGSYVPWLGFALTKFSPAGNRSVTCTPVASDGPLLVRVTVKVMVSPTLGVASLTDLVTARSAWGVRLLMSVSLALAGLVSVTPTGGVTVALISRVPVAAGL